MRSIEPGFARIRQVRFVPNRDGTVSAEMGDFADVFVSELFKETNFVRDGGDDVLIVNDSMNVGSSFASLSKKGAADTWASESVDAFARKLVCGK
jgi:hypothetical protein